MKKSIKSSKQKPNVQDPRPPVPSTNGGVVRWVVLGLGLCMAAGVTWGIMEFVVWNKLPSELVGTWEVIQGPPEFKDAVFEFHRSGKMTGRLNDNGNLRIMNAEVNVEADQLHIITRHPRTREEHVSVQIVRRLDDRNLEVSDERGRVIKMVRIP